MTTIVITEKTTQANQVRAAVGNEFGEILPAQGHLLTLQMPEDVNPLWDWKNWQFEVLRPQGGFYKTRKDPKAPDNVKRKLSRIEQALKGASRVILATDPDREGEGIGRELTDYFNFNGEIYRAMFTAPDPKTIRKAFKNLVPASNYENLYQAFRARQQGDQIFNLTMTRSATKSIIPEDFKGALGIGRVKTPTLGILCKRELEIEKFRSVDYFQIKAQAEVAAGSFEIRHDPERYGEKVKMTSLDDANRILDLANNFTGEIALKTEARHRGPPRLLDLPQMQKICGSRFGWSADRTLEVAQALYDVHEILTYPRAESKYLSKNHIEGVPAILDGLRGIDQYRELIPQTPVIREGKTGHFSDKGLEGCSHHAIIPNVEVMDRAGEIFQKLSEDETALFNLVTRHYLAAVSPDWEYEQTVATLDVQGFEFKALGNVTRLNGWKDVLIDDDDKTDKGTIDLPLIVDGEATRLSEAGVDAKKTKPPSRYNEGTLVAAMQDAWKFVDDGSLKERLKDAKGIGTPATRGEVIKGLHFQKQIEQKGKHVVPTAAGLQVYELLLSCAPDLVDPGYTARWELMLDDITLGKTTASAAIDQISGEAENLMGVLKAKRPEGFGKRSGPSAKMIQAAESCAARQGVPLPENFKTDYNVCKTFLDENMSSGPYPPSDKQIALVEKMIEEKGKKPPEGWREDSKIVSAYLDKLFAKSKSKGSDKKRKTRRR